MDLGPMISGDITQSYFVVSFEMARSGLVKHVWMVGGTAEWDSAKSIILPLTNFPGQYAVGLIEKLHETKTPSEETYFDTTCNYVQEGYIKPSSFRCHKSRAEE
jgi:hypothetical protein